MSSRTQPRRSQTGRPASAAQHRPRSAQRAVASGRAARRRTVMWSVAAAVVAVAGAATVIAIVARGSGNSASNAAAPHVGGDLHTVFTYNDALYVGGHDAVAKSRDGGHTFKPVPSLAGADAMGWASDGNVVLVGGHPGLFRSADGGVTFAPVTGANAVPDVHALGGAGRTLYLGSPQVGLMASTDGGDTWQVRNAQAGRSLMGTILVDPRNPARLIAPDMSAGLTLSRDGGRTWSPLGGPMGAMAAAWNPSDTDQILAVGMNGGAFSADGGATWRAVSLPSNTNTSAVTYDETGRVLYAGALDGQSARTYRSTDNGVTWTPTA